jgi:uncharacterized protein YecT (DUF1311 family)
MRKWATAALGIALSTEAMAYDIETSRDFDVCMDQSDGVTQSMVECIDAEVRQQDARLNRAYKELMASLSPPRQTQLRDAQRFWIKYRDANCAFYYNPEGGTIVRIEAGQCLLTTTATRAKELESFLSRE